MKTLFVILKVIGTAPILIAGIIVVPVLIAVACPAVLLIFIKYLTSRSFQPKMNPGRAIEPQFAPWKDPIFMP
ncbi:MAG TPA: hypothetical protein VMH27_08690 [Puia sp.]|nr:hypothetical protein [Puia sp.]